MNSKIQAMVPTEPPPEPIEIGHVTGAPLMILRAEGAILLAASSAAYGFQDATWWLFATLFFVPDVFMLGYLFDKRFGAGLYNLGHSTILPAVVTGLGVLMSAQLAVAIGLIWLAHVGFDRAVGYGLKYPDAFKNTHLGAPLAGHRSGG
jgi:hypothetical protein